MSLVVTVSLGCINVRTNLHRDRLIELDSVVHLTEMIMSYLVMKTLINVFSCASYYLGWLKEDYQWKKIKK